MNVRNFVLALGGLGLFACSGTPPPTARYASSQAAVRAAVELNAAQIPAAQLHLKLAEDQLEYGKRLMATGDNKRADYVLFRAESDADVAVALAKEADVRQQATHAIDQVQKARANSPLQNATPATPPPSTTAPTTPRVPPIPDPMIPPGPAPAPSPPEGK
jgi:hypothetical protein